MEGSQLTETCALLGQENYARTQKVYILKKKNYCALFLNCTEFRIEDLALGLAILMTGRKRRVGTCTEM